MIPYDLIDFPFGTPGWAVGAPVLTISWDEDKIGFIKPILLAYYDLPVNYYEETPVEIFRFDDPDVKEKIEVNDVVMTERGYDEYADYRESIVIAWNNEKNNELGSVAQ